MGAKEKTDFDRFVSEHSRNPSYRELTSDPKMTQILHQVISLLQSQQQAYPMQGGFKHRGPPNRGPRPMHQQRPMDNMMAQQQQMMPPPQMIPAPPV